MHTITKCYRDFPAAHRQPNHDGHCRMIHGHNWGFDITFACDTLDANGFVIDVGKLQDLKKLLTDFFDHTLLLNEDDNLRHDATFQRLMSGGLAKVVVVPNCGMEGLAKFVYKTVNHLIDMGSFDEAFSRDLQVVKVVVWEDSKNCATFQNNFVKHEDVSHT